MLLDTAHGVDAGWPPCDCAQGRLTAVPLRRRDIPTCSRRAGCRSVDEPCYTHRQRHTPSHARLPTWQSLGAESPGSTSRCETGSRPRDCARDRPQALLSLTRGRLKDAVIPSRPNRAWTVATLSGLPLSLCSTRGGSKMPSRHTVRSTRSRACALLSVSCTSQPTILRLYRSMIRYRKVNCLRIGPGSQVMSQHHT